MIAVIYNPVSGKNSDDLETIKMKLSESDCDYDLLITENEHSISAFFKQNRQYDTVVVAGGDGTISQTIDAMIQYDIHAAMCVYPRGSTNEFALALGITKESLVHLVDGTQKAQKIDIATYNTDHSFIYSMTFGNYTHITYQTPQQLKNVFGHVAYWLYGFFTFYFLKLRTYTMRVTCENSVYEGEFVFGSVSNSQSLGTVIQLSDVSFNDGVFELLLIRKPKTHRDFRKILKSLLTRVYDPELFIQSKGSVITFESETGYSWNKDGEFAGKLQSLSVKVHRDYLTLYR